MPASSKTEGRPEDRRNPGPIHTITSQVEKWRFKCPNWRHHNDWRIWNSIFCCQTCQQLRDAGEPDVDPVFECLWDAKEEELVPRERIRIDFGAER